MHRALGWTIHPGRSDPIQGAASTTVVVCRYKMWRETNAHDALIELTAVWSAGLCSSLEKDRRGTLGTFPICLSALIDVCARADRATLDGARFVARTSLGS